MANVQVVDFEVFLVNNATDLVGVHSHSVLLVSRDEPKGESEGLTRTRRVCHRHQRCNSFGVPAPGVPPSSHFSCFRSGTFSTCSTKESVSR